LTAGTTLRRGAGALLACAFAACADGAGPDATRVDSASVSANPVNVLSVFVATQTTGVDSARVTWQAVTTWTRSP